MKLEIVIALVGVGVAATAVAVAVSAVYYGNRNSKQQILVIKLEELYEVISSLSRYYGRFLNLQHSVYELRDAEYKKLETLEQYYLIRGQEIPEASRRKTEDYLSRIEVLADCYTTGELNKEILDYQDMMYSFSDFVFNAGSMHQELKYKKGFPDAENFHSLVTRLKKNLISEMPV